MTLSSPMCAGPSTTAEPVMNDLHMQIEPVARHHRVTELRLVDAEEIHEARLGIEGVRDVREDSPDLSQRFQNEHARHDGAAREMSLEPGLVEGHRLVS